MDSGRDQVGGLTMVSRGWKKLGSDICRGFLQGGAPIPSISTLLDDVASIVVPGQFENHCRRLIE